jgi:hypothetical protein
MILPWPGLADREVFMCGLYRKIAANLLVVMLISSSIMQAIPLQLVAPSHEQCREKSESMRWKLTYERRLRTAALAASGLLAAGYTVYMASKFYNWIMDYESVPKLPVDPAKRVSWLSLLSLDGAKNLAWHASASLLQAYCLGWIYRTITTDNTAPKNYIPKYIHHYYKVHLIEIERLLALRVAEVESGDTDLLIQGHVQALIDSIEHLVAYMLYAREQAPLHTQTLVEQYAHEVVNKVAFIAEQCNTASSDNFETAVTECKKQYAELLMSAARYAVTSLPSDE